MTDDSRGNEYWTPEPLLAGDTVFLLGGGPSLRDFDVQRLRGRRVMAINCSCAICPWAEFLYFTDTSWFEHRRTLVAAWPGTVITASRVAKAALPEKLKRIQLVTQPDFTIGEPVLKFGRSSGHTAISVAIAMGAARVILLGYDMQIVGGRSHHHNEYHTEDIKLFRDDFLVHFQGWGEAARRIGVEVLNCTPGSALAEFPMRSIDDVLAEAAHVNHQHPHRHHAGAFAGPG